MIIFQKNKKGVELKDSDQVVEENESIISFTAYAWFFGMMLAVIFAVFAYPTFWGRIFNGLSMLCAILSISSIVVNVATQIKNKIMKKL